MALSSRLPLRGTYCIAGGKTLLQSEYVFSVFFTNYTFELFFQIDHYKYLNLKVRLLDLKFLDAILGNFTRTAPSYSCFIDPLKVSNNLVKRESQIQFLNVKSSTSDELQGTQSSVKDSRLI